MLRALLAPYQGIQFMPTGGIGLHNVKDCLSIQGVISCGLSWMTDPELIKMGNWDEIEERLQKMLIEISQGNDPQKG